MKNLIIILLLCVATINAQDFVHTHFVKGDSPYLTDSVIDAKYKVIEKFTKTFEDPLDDYFWPKTPGELWDTNVRNYIITLNNKGDYNLFVLDNDSFNSLDIGMYFQFLSFMELGSIYSDLGKYNKEEIKKEIAKFFN